MSDQDVRKGYRALISGGAAGLGDEEVAHCIQALSKAQNERGNTPSVAEVAYLQEFVKISEEYINKGVSSGGFQTTETQEKLDELNTRFPDLNEAVRRTEIIAPTIESNLYDEGWMASSYQC